MCFNLFSAAVLCGGCRRGVGEGGGVAEAVAAAALFRVAAKLFTGGSFLMQIAGTSLLDVIGTHFPSNRKPG